MKTQDGSAGALLCDQNDVKAFIQYSASYKLPRMILIYEPLPEPKLFNLSIPMFKLHIYPPLFALRMFCKDELNFCVHKRSVCIIQDTSPLYMPYI